MASRSTREPPPPDARSVDSEDYAVMFELDRLRALQRGTPPVAPRAYDLLMVDEAQELAPLERVLLGRSLAPGGSLVVAGDPAQQIDPSVTFTGWADTMRELGREDHDEVTLDAGYRCPPDVVALARHVLDPRLPAAPGPSVVRCALPEEAAIAALVAAELSALARRDRTATRVVLCRSPLFARRFVERLRAGVPARLVLDGRFLARGGVQVTTLDQVRGLEFDTVVVPDADAATYPDDPSARRALYVAVTRARHQVLSGARRERDAPAAGGVASNRALRGGPREPLPARGAPAPRPLRPRGRARGPQGPAAGALPRRATPPDGRRRSSRTLAALAAILGATAAVTLA